MDVSPRSRERQAFHWACGWLSALSLVWTGHLIFSHIVHQRMAKMLVIADGDYLPELEAYFLATDPWLDASRIAVFFMATGFTGCLTWWLLAIRRRRMASLCAPNVQAE